MTLTVAHGEIGLIRAQVGDTMLDQRLDPALRRHALQFR